MDLIAEFTSKLGVDAGAAKAIAGAVLGGVEQQVADKLGPAEASQLANALPELSGWKDQLTRTMAGAGGGAGGLGGALSGALGGGGMLGALGGAVSAMGGGGDGAGLGAVTSLLGKLNLKASTLGTVVPLVLKFLESRVPPELLGKLKAAAPLLGAGGGGLDAMLKGLIK